MDKQEILFLSGLPGAGKSHMAKSLVSSNPDYKRVNKDDIRKQLGVFEWSIDVEEIVLDTEREYGNTWLDYGFSLIVDDTNFSNRHKEYWMDVAKDRKITFVEKFINTPLEVCIERDSKRVNPVGKEVITSMYNKYIKGKDLITDDRFILEQNKNLTPCCIVDIDGTLALINNRNPFDDTKIHTDRVNTPVKRMVNKKYDEYAEKDGEVLIVSGRPECLRDQTEKWLLDNGVFYSKLFLKQNEDKRKDYIIKQEIYESEIKDKYFVEFILEDKQSVVNMYRELGLLCLQVYNTNV